MLSSLEKILGGRAERTLEKPDMVPIARSYCGADAAHSHPDLLFSKAFDLER
jgi:hypothetical protein